MKLSIIIPVRNERETALRVIERVREVDCAMAKEIIVIDGASTDGTREALRSLPPADGLVLVLEDAARGKGRAVRTGFARSTGDIVMVQDADLELDPGEIPSLIAPIIDGRTDVVFGSRFKGRGRGRTPWVGYAGNMLLTTATNVLFRARLTDILTCYKVLRGELARSLDLTCDGFDLDAEIACRLLRDGHAIAEVPVRYEPRGADAGKKLTAGAGWSVLKAIVAVRFSSRQPAMQRAPHAGATTPVGLDLPAETLTAAAAERDRRR